MVEDNWILNLIYYIVAPAAIQLHFGNGPRRYLSHPHTEGTLLSYTILLAIGWPCRIQQPVPIGNRVPLLIN